jgi:hypothetical protein
LLNSNCEYFIVIILAVSVYFFYVVFIFRYLFALYVIIIDSIPFNISPKSVLCRLTQSI